MRPWLTSTVWLVSCGGFWIVVLKHWGPGWAAAGGICTLGAFTNWCQTTMRALRGEYTPVPSHPPQHPGPRRRRLILEDVSTEDPQVIRRIILEEEDT